MKQKILWNAAGSEAPRRFRAATGFQILCVQQRLKEMSLLRAATAAQKIS